MIPQLKQRNKTGGLSARGDHAVAENTLFSVISSFPYLLRIFMCTCVLGTGVTSKVAFIFYM